MNELSLLDEAISDEPPATLQNTGIIRPGYSSELDNIIQSSRDAREWIANLEQVERDRTGIKTLKVGYNKVFGYYIEITHSNTNSAPPEYIRKQTLVNAERYITPEMKEYETLVLNAEERIHEVEGRLFREICRNIASNSIRAGKNSPVNRRIGCGFFPGGYRRYQPVCLPGDHCLIPFWRSSTAATRWWKGPDQ